MKKLLLMKTMLLLCALIVGSSSVWAEDLITIWSENFDGLAAEATPTSPTNSAYTGVTYTCTNGAGTSAGSTKVMNDNLAGGAAAPELMVGKKGSGTGAAGGKFIVVIPLDSYEGTLTLTYYQNKNSLKVSSPTAGVTGGQTLKPSVAGQQTTTFTGITTEMTSVTIEFEATTTSNVRLDDILLTGTVATGKESAGLAYSKEKYATTFGASFATPVLANPNSLAVTYATSDATVADVNASTGAVTIKNKIGSAIITASTAGDETHDEGTASYTIYVFEHDGSAANNAYTVAEARTFIMNELYDENESYYLSGIVASVGSFDNTTKGITYYISDNGENSNTITVYKGKGLNGADFAAKEDMQVLDQVTLLGKFLYYNSATPEITNSEQVWFKRKAPADLLVEDDFDMYRDTEKNVTDLYATTSDGEVSFESSDETIAKIEGGKLKALAVGTATITINVAATDDYRDGSDVVAVTVKNRPAVAPAGTEAGTGYFIVTDASTLEDGDKILFVSSISNGTAKAMSTNQKTNNRGVTDVTIENQKIASISADVQVATLEKSSGKFYFNVGKGYLYAASKNANHLKTEVEKDENALATITIAGDATASVVFDGENRCVMRYNASNSLFACYANASSVEDFYIYKYGENNTFDVTIGATGYKTLISAVSATLPAGLTAYKAVSAGEGKIQLTSVASIKAGCAYVLKGTASTDYTLTVTNTPEEPTGNILEVSDENASNGVYVLANGTSGPGFYKWMGGSLGAGRAIVPASAVSSSAREYLEFSFDNDVTAIEAVKTQNVENAQFFNLAGQRVAQPTKGLYIVNGKKVVIK